MDLLLTLLLAFQVAVPPARPAPPAQPPLPEVEEEVIVTATRTGRLAGDQPMRVEVVGREEIEEKLLMTPGDIAMLLNETSGIRLQPTSPSLGAASVRVQGLPGRFTAVLTDGLPINGTQVASIGLLQIPPMDLAQVEVIKGAASALYGPSALGGVINLVTRRPTETREGELLLNATTRRGFDAVWFSAGPAVRDAGYTLLLGGHAQDLDDVDEDGWADVPRYRRMVARPKVSFTSGATAMDLTAGVNVERRRGGLTALLDGREAIDTDRIDVGLTARRPVAAGVLVGKAALVRLAHTHAYGAEAYDDRHQGLTLEGSFLFARGRHTLVVGGGLDWQRYRSDLARHNTSWATPSLFAQDDVTVSDRVTLSLSARVDAHSEYGALFSPRASVRWRLEPWDVRVSAGRGAFAPSVHVDEVESVGLHRVGAVTLTRAETAETLSMDVTREAGPLELGVTLFGALVHHAVAAEVRTDGPARLDVFTRTGDAARIDVIGAELFARVRRGHWVATASHVSLSTDQPLTPARTFSVVGAWEDHGRARVGFEVYYTGRQTLDDNPYRDRSAPYVIVGLLAERRFGQVRAFVNLENLTDVRQSDYDPLPLPTPSVLGKRAVSAWAPLDGRTINAGVRIGF